MWLRFRDFWVPRLLFVATLVCAAIFAILVLVAPWVSETDARGLLALFAGDAIVARVTVLLSGRRTGGSTSFTSFFDRGFSVSPIE